MREDYRDYIPERDPITRETPQELEDFHDNILNSLDEEKQQEPLEE